MGKGDASCVFPDEGADLDGEELDVSDKQLSVFLLPFVAMGLCVSVFQECLQMGGFVEKDPEKEIRIEVAVDGNLMERVAGCSCH